MSCTVKTTRRVTDQGYFESYDIYPESDVLGILLKNKQKRGFNKENIYFAKDLIVTDVEIKTGLGLYIKALLSHFSTRTEKLITSKKKLINRVTFSISQHHDTKSDTQDLLPVYEFILDINNDPVTILVLIAASAMCQSKFNNIIDNNRTLHDYQNYGFWGALRLIRDSLLEQLFREKPKRCQIFFRFSPFTIPSCSIGLTRGKKKQIFPITCWLEELRERHKRLFILNNIELIRKLKTIYVCLLLNYDPISAFMLLIFAFTKLPSAFPLRFRQGLPFFPEIHYYSLYIENQDLLQSTGVFPLNDKIFISYNKHPEVIEKHVESIKQTNPFPHNIIIDWNNRLMNTVNLIIATETQYFYRKL